MIEEIISLKFIKDKDVYPVLKKSYIKPEIKIYEIEETILHPSSSKPHEPHGNAWGWHKKHDNKQIEGDIEEDYAPLW